MIASKLPNPGVDHQTMRHQVALSIAKLTTKRNATGEPSADAVKVLALLNAAVVEVTSLTLPIAPPEEPEE